MKDVYTSAEWNALKQKKVHKYASNPKTVDGIYFQSTKEAERYSELKLLQDAGEVSFFLMQVPFVLWGTDNGNGKPEKYVLDFVVFWSDGKVSYEDVKGYQTDKFKRKKKIVERLYPITIELK